MAQPWQEYVPALSHAGQEATYLTQTLWQVVFTVKHWSLGKSQMCLHSRSFLPTCEDKKHSWATVLLSVAAVTTVALPVLNRPSSSSLVPIPHTHRSQLGWVLPSRRAGCRMIAPGLQETRVWRYELSG